MPSFPWLLTYGFRSSDQFITTYYSCHPFPDFLQMVFDPQTSKSLLFMPSFLWLLTNGFQSSDQLITTIPANLSLTIYNGFRSSDHVDHFYSCHPLTDHLQQVVSDPQTCWSLLFLPSSPWPLTMVVDPQTCWSLLFLPLFPWLLTMVSDPQSSWSLLFLKSFPWPITIIFVPQIRWSLLVSLHCYKRYLKWSSPLENCSSGNGKRPCWCWNTLSLAHAGILHSSMLEMSSGMEECKITAWASDNMSLSHADILHFSRPEISEECLIVYVLCSIISGNCGLVVKVRISYPQDVSSILHCAHSIFSSQGKSPENSVNSGKSRYSGVYIPEPNRGIIFPSPDCWLRRHPVRVAEYLVRSCYSVPCSVAVLNR